MTEDDKQSKDNLEQGKPVEDDKVIKVTIIDKKSLITFERLVLLLTTIVSLFSMYLAYRAIKYIQIEFDESKPNIVAECNESFYGILKDQPNNKEMIAVYGLTITNKSSKSDTIELVAPLEEMKYRPGDGKYDSRPCCDFINLCFRFNDIYKYYGKGADNSDFDTYNVLFGNFYTLKTWQEIVPVRLDSYEKRKSYFFFKVTEAPSEMKRPAYFIIKSLREADKAVIKSCPIPTKLDNKRK